jgi:hypothetical protein
MNEDELFRLYQHQGEYYVLIRSVGTMVVEGPEEGNGKESTLRLFINLADAIKYKDQDQKGPETRVHKTTLVGLWNILDRVNNLSLRQFKVPVRVDASAFDRNGVLISVDTFHSTYALPS